MEQLRFEHPRVMLLLAVVVPVIVALFLAGYARKRQMRSLYGEKALVDSYSRPLNPFRDFAVGAVWMAIAVCLLLAWADPITPTTPSAVPLGQLDVVVVSDVSLSMAALAYTNQLPAKNGVPAEQIPGYGSNLDMAKYIITSQIMPAIVGNRLGIATYRGNGFDQADLSDDFVTLRWVLDHWVKIGNAPGGGSDTADGLKVALQIFDQAQPRGKERAVVLFTDGGFTGDPSELNQVLVEIRSRGIRLIVLGLGSDTPVGVPAYSARSLEVTNYIQVDGQTVTTTIDEQALIRLAATGGGTYIRARPGQPLKINWVGDLAGSRASMRARHLYQFPLALAIILFIVMRIAKSKGHGASSERFGFR